MGAFLAAALGLELVALKLKLAPLAAASLGQLGILAVALAFAALDGDGMRNLGITGRWQGYDSAVIVGIIAIHMVGSIITGALMLGAGQTDMGRRASAALLQSFGTYETGTFMLIALGLALQSGITEELLFRGYMITRLERLGLGQWPVILSSALIFGLVHWPGYGFLASMSKAVWFGIPTGLFFWRRRSLGPLVAAHALMNFLGFVTAHFAAKLMPNFPLR